MTKRAFFAVAGFLGLCLPLMAQPTNRPGALETLDDSVVCFPSLTLLNRGPFSFASALETASRDFLPPLNMANITARPRRAAAATAADDSSKEVVDVERPLFDYATGEIGFFYGRSTGKFDREVEAGHIFGEAGNEHFQISVGAAYEHFSGRVPRFGR
jgi:hypothetical protein